MTLYLNYSNMSSKKMFFAAALMLSAVNAEDDISRSLNRLERTLNDKEAISPARRFNLEALISQSLTTTTTTSADHAEPSVASKATAGASASASAKNPKEAAHQQTKSSKPLKAEPKQADSHKEQKTQH